MRYFIVRRNARLILSGILFVMLLGVILLWVIQHIFIHEDVTTPDTFFRPIRYPVSEKISDTDVSIDITYFGDGYIFSRIKIEDIALFKDKIVSADLAAKGRIISDGLSGQSHFSGKLISKRLLFDSKEIFPMRMLFDIKDNELRILSLFFGKSINLQGTICLAYPFKTDLRLDITRLDMRGRYFVSPASSRRAMFGIINGRFYLKGNLAGNIFSQGFVESRNGSIGSITYNVATLNLEGFGPIINIVDCNIREDTGRIFVEGYIDLRDITSSLFLDGIKVTSDVGNIVWKGWDITRKGTDELDIKKTIGENINVGFKAMSRKPLTSYEEMQRPEEMSLEYKVGLQNLKMKLKENEEFFGIERSIRF